MNSVKNNRVVLKILEKKVLILKWIVLLIIVGVVIWGYRLPIDTTSHWSFLPYTINDDWTQIINNQSYPLNTAQDSISLAGGETIVLERTVTENVYDSHLVFYAEHQEVAVYVEDDLLYQLTCPEELSFFGSPGQIWVDVLIPDDAFGKTLRVELTSQFTAYQTVPLNLYWIKSEEVNSVQIRNTWFCNFAALIILGLAILSYANGNIWEDKELRHYLFTLGDLFLFFAMWICAELNVLSIIFSRAAVSSMLSMIFVRIIPIAYYYMCKAAIKDTYRWFPMAGGIFWINLFVGLILQFGFGISLLAQLSYYNIIVFICALSYVIDMIYRFVTNPYSRYANRIYYVSVILPIVTLCEIYCYMNHQQKGIYTGIATSVGCLIYAIFVHVFLVKQESVTDTQKRAMEMHYQVLQRKPLTTQINAHFLGNALNTISAYCKEDPIKADRGVQILATYMRKYMHMVNEGECVSLEEELYLVQLYLEIQNMRFEDSIVVEIHNRFDGFLLPSLCLQPLVENAVHYGIRSLGEKGKVVISTKKKNGMAEITVQDNGVGFEMDKMGDYRGVSLININTRILALGGTMEIQSELGIGTVVILRVPVEEYDLEED